jgi:hypothetical protein
MKRVLKKFSHLFLSLVALVLFSTCSKEGSEAISPGLTGKGGSMARFTISGNFLYIVEAQNLLVYSLADPANPLFLKSMEIGPEIETIFPFKNRLFVGSRTAVYFFSLNDPANPVLESKISDPVINMRCDPVVANDTMAFATLNASGPCGGFQSILAVYDIRDFNKPVKIADRNLSAPFGLAYQDSILYVCDGAAGLKLFNINNTSKPIEIRILRDANYLDVIPYENLLVCWTRTGMRLFDISNPANPEFITELR